MALRYRNEQVITNLRTAYTLKHHGDSFLLDSTPETFIPREPGELESDILDLELKPDLAYNDLNDDKIQHFSPTSTSPLSSILRSSKFADPAQLETHVGTATDSDFAVSHNAKSLMRWKELGLDLDDDSDFEDKILQAAYSAAYDRKIPKPWKQNALSTADTYNGIRNMNLNDLFVKREISINTNNGDDNGEPGRFAPETAHASSNLTSMLTSRGEDPREQYLEAVAGLRGNGNKFKMHIPGIDPIIITIKPDCSTHLAIGYTLLKANVEKGDANLYTLRLTEDDGEPDEDFPALDRVRPVASYHADEFAIVRATEAEYRENCKRTPNKVAFKFQHVPASKPSQSHLLQVQHTRKDQHMHSHQSVQPKQSNIALNRLSQQIQQFQPDLLIQSQNNNHNISQTKQNVNMLPQQNHHQQKPPASPVHSPPPVPPMHAPPQPPGEESSITIRAPLALPPNRLQTVSSKLTPILPTDNATRPTALAPFGTTQFGTQQRPSGPTRPQRSFASSLSGTKFESILVRVYMYPYDPLLSPVFWSDDMATRQSKMVDIFEQMCRDKMMDPEMYILRTADPARQAIDLQKEIGNFISQSATATAITPTLPPTTPGSEVSESSHGTGNSSGALYVDIEVVALRNLPGGQQNALRPRAGSKPTENLATSTNDSSVNSVGNSTANLGGIGSANAGGTSNSSIHGSSNSANNDTSQDILKNSVLAMQQPFGFYKYSVVRLKVLGGSAKELVIDGENVHIMPPSDRSMVDQPKTTSFHIRQVIRVKQSRKTETNFSIAIMKPGGPKTYDIECQNSQIAREIVDRLQRLKTARAK